MRPDIVGRRLKRMRQALGLGQKELAELADVQQSFISQIETGARRGSTIQLDAARRLAFVLGVTLDELGGAPKEKKDSEQVPTAASLIGV